MNCWRQRYGFSLAEKTGGTAIGLAILLGLIDPRLACIPLGSFPGGLPLRTVLPAMVLFPSADQPRLRQHGRHCPDL